MSNEDKMRQFITARAHELTGVHRSCQLKGRIFGLARDQHRTFARMAASMLELHCSLQGVVPVDRYVSASY
jgi:hypothetical protein